MRQMEATGCPTGGLSHTALPRPGLAVPSLFLASGLLRLNRGLVCRPRQGTRKSCHVAGLDLLGLPPSFRKDFQACGVSGENWCLRVSVPWTWPSSCNITDPGLAGDRTNPLPSSSNSAWAAGRQFRPQGALHHQGQGNRDLDKG